MPALFDYHRDVRFQPDASIYDIKIDSLRVWAENYTGGSPISTELFDGSYKTRSFGWRVRAEFDWDEMKQIDHDLLDTMILDIIANGGTSVDFDPVNDTGVKIVAMVLDDVDAALSATFDAGVRGRSASLSLVSESILAAPPTWLTS